MEKPFVIDMHNHFIPPEALPLICDTAEHNYLYSVKRFAKAFSVMTDIEAHKAWMDQCGIDMAILSTATYVPCGLAFCQACNAGLAAMVRRYPNRYRAVIHISPFDNKDDNLAEIKRGVEELGLWGIGLVSSMQALNLDDPVYDYVYEVAVKYDMPVYVHPTIRRNLWGGEKYDLFLTAAREYDLTKACIEMIYGVVPRYPALKVIMSHLGGGLPAVLGRVIGKHQPDELEIPAADYGQWLTFHHAEKLGVVEHFMGLLHNFCFDTAGHGGWPPLMEFAIKVLGVDKLCFGTDFPYDFNQAEYVCQNIADLRDMGLTAKEEVQFFSGNIKQIFKIS